MKLESKGSVGLIALLVVVLIIGVAAAVYCAGKGGVGSVDEKSQLLDSKSQKQTTVGKSIDTAKVADCRERLKQIRMGIENYKISSNDALPSALPDIGLGVGPDYFRCPVSGQSYNYDPATGAVSCPTHDNF